MSKGASANKKIGAGPGVGITVSILILCSIVVGTWEYRRRWYAAPPPPVQIERPAVKAVLRWDSTVRPTQNAPEQPSSRQQHEDSSNGALPPDYEANLVCFERPKRQIDQKLIAKLGADYPGISEILKSDYARNDPKIVRQLLDTLLERANSASPEKKPPLLLAADAIAERLALPSIVPANPELQHQLDTLAAQGLTFTWAELDGGWSYHNNLLWRLWREYPTSEEGEDAFVLLLGQGWDKDPCCNTNANSFHTVIEHGEEFLSNRPHAAHRQDVLFLVAQAYETWWSLSLVPERDREEGDPPPAAYRAGSAAAREKAIAYYSEIVTAAADSVEANCSRKPLDLLKKNEDTHQRRFYCYCD
jgi:hypothetical protein